MFWVFIGAPRRASTVSKTIFPGIPHDAYECVFGVPALESEPVDSWL